MERSSFNCVWPSSITSTRTILVPWIRLLAVISNERLSKGPEGESQSVDVGSDGRLGFTLLGGDQHSTFFPDFDRADQKNENHAHSRDGNKHFGCQRSANAFDNRHKIGPNRA